MKRTGTHSSLKTALPRPQLQPKPELDNLKAIARAIVETLGERSSEVLIHDLSDLEHSIVWVEGNVTSRCIGGAMTDLGISKVQAGDFDPVLNYTTETDDGRTLKSCSIFLRGPDGIPWGAFCINLDVTVYLGLVNQLKATLLHVNETNVVESFSDDVEVTVRNWLAEAAFEIGKPVDSLNRADRLRVIEILDRKGLFQIKRAIPLLAKYLRVSRYTIYVYLNELRTEAKESIMGGI